VGQTLAFLVLYGYVHTLVFNYITELLAFIYKFSLVGRQLPKKYKENFDVSSEGPLSGARVY
jgi:hypothetical protein